MERTLAWITAHRRLARDYERNPAHSEAMIRWAAINTMTRRLARGRPATRPGPRPSNTPDKTTSQTRSESEQLTSASYLNKREGVKHYPAAINRPCLIAEPRPRWSSASLSESFRAPARDDLGVAGSCLPWCWPRKRNSTGSGRITRGSAETAATVEVPLAKTNIGFSSRCSTSSGSTAAGRSPQISRAPGLVAIWSFAVTPSTQGGMRCVCTILNGVWMESLQAAVGLAYVCANLQEIRSLFGDEGAGPAAPLPRLLAALQALPGSGGQEASKEQIPELLSEVHTALQAQGDALGVFGHSGRVRGLDAAGVESLEIVYRCPLKVCTGRDEAESSQFPPRCSISQAELMRERLDT